MRNDSTDVVHSLTTLEERLVSLRIAFAQIRQLGYKRAQYGLNGTIINVSVDFDKVQVALPRQIDETKTIAVRLKRKLQYENAYEQGNVRPACVVNALTVLSKTPLYIQEKISISKDWEVLFVKNKEHNQVETETKTDMDDTLSDLEDEPITKSLIHWFNDPHSIKDLDTTIIDIAPSKGFKPLSIFQDVYSEEMNFPTLFYGFPRPEEITKTFTYQKIAKWELMHKDRDFANHISNIFFKAILCSFVS
jgi:hypothetical protein